MARAWPGLRLSSAGHPGLDAADSGRRRRDGHLHDRRDFLGSLAGLVVWGGAQQWVLQTVVLREAQRATSRNAGIVIAALLFGAMHVPNPFLAVVTIAAALFWCWLYDRHPNIVPVALSHALGTLAILYAFDQDVTGRLRIGACTCGSTADAQRSSGFYRTMARLGAHAQRGIIGSTTADGCSAS